MRTGARLAGVLTTTAPKAAGHLSMATAFGFLLFAGFADAVMPLRTGAPDVAFPASTPSPTGSSSSAE
ncbi:hypothetical protein GCM10010275_42550 [Streptomyces litmocidini]|uniref:hypothetical protein n=1 Tax=Streptomyces litmocidini TaxID=67318 RepID=UPI0019ABA4E9|nr:hypothetical protein GCM10010275_42550 [Streptomyces litmocidini]